MTKLQTTEYNRDYYEEHKIAGLDYLNYGYWQASYAQMVTDATMQRGYREASVLDAGAACGTQLNGFRETGVFSRICGIDITDHMVKIGRKHFNYSDQELITGSLTSIPVESGTVSLLHSHQVLEHIPEEHAEAMMQEFLRVLRPGGRAFIVLDAVRTGETKEQYLGDPTHVNIQPISYWTELFQKNGLYFDVEAYNRFVRGAFGPTNGDPTTFFQQYPYWSVWTLIKGAGESRPRDYWKHPLQRWLSHRH